MNSFEDFYDYLEDKANDWLEQINHPIRSSNFQCQRWCQLK